jgi:hypothetical protein
MFLRGKDDRMAIQTTAVKGKVSVGNPIGLKKAARAELLITVTKMFASTRE